MPRGLGHAPPVLPDAPRQERKVIRRFLPYLWPAGQPALRVRIVIAVLLILANKAVLVTTPFFLSRATDALTGQQAQIVAVPILLLSAYGLARFAAVGLAQLRDALFSKVSMHASRLVALETFEHLHRLSLRFHLDRRTGGLSRAIERGVRAIDFLLRFMLFNIVPTFLELALVAGIFLTKFGLAYAGVLVAGVLGYVGFTAAVTEWRTKFRRQMNERDSAANTKAVDSLLNFETVKYFNNEAHETARYDRAVSGYQHAAIRSQASLSALNAGQSLIVSAALAGILILAARDVVQGQASVGDFVLVNSLMIQLFVPLNLLGFVYREIKQALIDMEAMFALKDEPQDVADAAEARPLTISGGTVEFQDVQFGYDPRRPVLQGVSFTVPAGRTLAIVGPSGAGKSTIARILYRFYDIDRGAVRIDGQDIRQVTQDSLRRAIGIVPQDTVLFNDTIAYNLDYGRPGTDRARLEEAARLAQVDRFIEALPDGYDTLVGERGLKLSGGEKQRVAIARTIVKDPPILILDEATSALDTHTEREIQAALDRVAQGRTTLMIAHRLSTVVKADEILVLTEGRVAERGTHEALLAKGGLYAAMWASQQQDGREQQPATAPSPA